MILRTFTMFLRRYFSVLALVSSFGPGIANADNPNPLPLDQAFNLTAQTVAPNTVVATWNIAPDYYLYRHSIKIAAETPQHAQIGPIKLPTGTSHNDEFFGHFQALTGKLQVTIPIVKQDGPILLKFNYQGCAQFGFCYPPQQKIISLASGSTTPPSINTYSAYPKYHANFLSSVKDSWSQLWQTHSADDFVNFLSTKQLLWILPLFFVLGLLLAFTPCVLPLVPILATIIVNRQATTSMRKRAFSLSLTYVLAMACTYAGIGIFAAFLGESLQSALQQPWVLILISLLLVIFAGSLLDFYTLQLPARWQNAVTNLSARQQGGQYLSVALMGICATLVLSPCVTPPLIGALTFIGQTGDVLLGGSALFTLGLGIGTPLLIAGTVGGHYLPKAGAWMQDIKKVMGLILIALAIYVLDRIMPGYLTLILFGCLAIVSAIVLSAPTLRANSQKARVRQGFCLILLIYGFVLVIGGFQGNDNFLQPLHIPVTDSQRSQSYTAANQLHVVTNPEQLALLLTTAQVNKQPVLLDFYAKWCIACQHIEHEVLQDPAVSAALKNTMLIQVDITQNDAAAKALLKQYNVIAPPTLVFLDQNGQERIPMRVIGEISRTNFIDHISNTKN